MISYCFRLLELPLYWLPEYAYTDLPLVLDTTFN